MGLRKSEYTVLRHTIANRGTARMVLFPVTAIGWAVVSSLGTANGPLASILALGVLTAGFEAIHALHVGVERIGRYLQVFYEDEAGGPRWETTAMSVGPALPGGGVDPLFTVLFVLAVAINLLAALVASRGAVELATTSGLHAVFIVRLLRARGAATRQRAIDLESYRAVRTRLASEQR